MKDVNQKQNKELSELINICPDCYENIYKHPEFDDKIERNCSEREEIIIEYIKKYQNLVGRKNIKILDIGCNTAYFLFKCKELGCEVYGVDFNEIAIKIANFINKENNFDCKFENRYIDLDFLKLLQDKEFDFIFLFRVIHHITKWSGLDYAKEFIKIISQKCKIFLTELATKYEPFFPYLPDNYNVYLENFSYWTELKFCFISHNKQLPIYCPFIFASNDYILLKNDIDNSINILSNKNNYNSQFYINNDSYYLNFGFYNISFKKEMLIYAPYLVSSFLNKFNESFLKKEFIINEKQNKILLNKKEIGCMYRNFFDFILKTSFYLDKNNNVYSKTKFTNTFRKNISNDSIIVKSNLKRYLTNEKTLYDIINENKSNLDFIKNQFEIFIQEIFKKYRTKHNDLLMSSSLNSATHNCIIKNDKYIFFDEKLKLKGKYVDKSFILWRIISSSFHFREPKLENELYSYFCDKFNLDYKPNWCLYYERTIWNYEYKLSLDKNHLEQTIRTKKIKYPKWLVNLLCCFIVKKKNRHNLRKKYTKK